MSQKALRMVLFAAAVVVWGVVIYRLVPRSAPVGALAQVSDAVRFDTTAERTPRHVADYADPFLFEANAAIPQVRRAAPSVPEIQPPRVDFAQVYVVGILEDYALVGDAQGEVRIVERGASYRGAVLVKIFTDSLVFVVDGREVGLGLE